MKNLIKKLILFTLVISLLFDVNIFIGSVFAKDNIKNNTEKTIVKKDAKNSNSSDDKDDLDDKKDGDSDKDDLDDNNDGSDGYFGDEDIDIDTKIKINVVALLDKEKIEDSSLNPSKSFDKFEYSIYDILYNIFGTNNFENNYTNKNYEILNYEINGKIYDKNSIKDNKIDLSDKDLKELNINVNCQNIYSVKINIGLKDIYHPEQKLSNLSRNIKVRPKDEINISINKKSRTISIKSSYESTSISIPSYYRSIEDLEYDFEFDKDMDIFQKDLNLDLRPIEITNTGISFKNIHNEKNVNINFKKLNEIENNTNKNVFSNEYKIENINEDKDLKAKINKSKNEDEDDKDDKDDNNFIDSATLTVLNRSNEINEENYEEDSIYYNDKINASLKNTFAEDVLSSGNHIYDFDLFLDNGNKKEISEEELNFSITPNRSVNKTFNFDSKRVNYIIISDFNGQKVKNEYWVTMDQIVKFNGQNIDNYTLKNKNINYIFEASTGNFKNSNSNTVVLEYILKSRTVPDSDSLNINYNVLNKLTNQFGADENTNKKHAPRFYKGYKGSEITVSPIRNHDFKDDDYKMSRFRLADDKTKTKILKSDHDFSFQYICDNLTYYIVKYLVVDKDENGNEVIKEFMKPEVKFDKTDTTVKIIAKDLSKYNLYLSDDCINHKDTEIEKDEDGNVINYYKKIKLDEDGKVVFFKYDGNLELPEIKTADITIAFYRHRKECNIEYPYTDKNCTEGCKYFQDVKSKTGEYVKFSIPLSETKSIIEMPIMQIIGSGHIQTIKLNNELLKNLTEFKNKSSDELAEYDKEHDVYIKPDSLNVDLCREKFKDYKSLTEEDNQKYDIEVFYKMTKGDPETLPSILSDVNLNHKYRDGIEFKDINLENKDYSNLITQYLTGTTIYPRPISENIGIYEREDEEFNVVEEPNKSFKDGSTLLIDGDKTIIYKYKTKDEFIPKDDFRYKTNYYWINNSSYENLIANDKNIDIENFTKYSKLGSHGSISPNSQVSPIVVPASNLYSSPEIKYVDLDGKEHLDENGNKYRFRYEYIFEEGPFYDENHMTRKIVKNEQEIQIKYIRHTKVTKLPPNIPGEKDDGSYTVNYLYSKKQNEDGTTTNISPAKSFFKIQGNLLRGTVIGAIAFDFKNFGYIHLSEEDEAYKTMKLSYNNELNFYYTKKYNSTEIDKIPENCYINYLDYNDKNNMNISISDIKIAFPEETVSATAKNFEDIGYFLLAKNKAGKKELTLNYDLTKNTIIENGKYNKIDFFYRRLKDNEYFLNYKVRYVTEEKDGVYKDLIDPKEVKELELNGFDDYFENPKLIEGYRTTDKPYKVTENNIEKTKEIIFVYTQLGYVVKYIDMDTKETLDISEKKIVNIPENKDGENTIYAIEKPKEIEHHIAISDNKTIDHKGLLEKYSIENNDENNEPIT